MAERVRHEDHRQAQALKFDWNMGGRLYSYGEFNYQQLDRSQRLRMTINGEPVCEIDIRASYLTIFHALYDEPFDPTNDPYKVAGLGPEARDVVKMWITASFGNNAPITKWPTELVAKYREVPSLAVHDSLIVPLSRWHETVID